MTELSYLQAVVIGLLQGVTELFPISSLGHSVLVPALFGGSWYHLVTESSTGNSGESPYLAFIVALHVATALALLVFFWRDWVRIIGGFLHTLRVLDELVPAALHVTEQYANNAVEADHGRLKARLRPMRGLKRLRSAAVIAAGHAFVQNLRRGHYELAVDISPPLRLATASIELALAI